ncbi:phage portal protein [Streptococcus acidominimus]|uniref:Phage portal protein n=1 Tax=Streptococcus acidominimus TaxID=1326 RepID=A0A4Y9FP10_STRAI|nr:phage portal protein [Streptococcus acidominimus]MBF0818739.1 phage portal protein [Streptococcus acidominimus]MBF0838317.1 phage portal protein [Streptococcus acidominimus]MBF0848964.1 phage portal protein [Streptococcus danieliae]TFU30901.1 phage portal protein [Streptococcus acidominimus]
MGWLRFFRKDRDLDPSFDVGDLERAFESLYLKGLAVDKSAEFLARIVAQSEFRYLKDGKRWDNDWTYLLNVSPNRNESASQFWQKLVYRLITKNEVLVILTDDNQLLIADGYIRQRYTCYDDTFESVNVGSFTFKRKFKMGDVIFLQYNNNRLEEYLSGLFIDYQKLYTRIIEALARNGQIRGVLKAKANASFDEEKVKKLQSYADKLFKSFTNKSVSIAPTMDGIEYEELTNKVTKSVMSVDEIKKLKYQFEDDISDILGIPTALRHGDMANLENNQKLFFVDCLAPLNKKIADQLNAKIIGKSQFKLGHRWQIVGVDRRDLFDLATNIDKLISSGSFNVNEIRAELGYEAIASGNRYFMTKNYQELNEKGEPEIGETDSG